MPPTNQKYVIAPSQSEKASKKVFHSSSGRELPTVNEWDAKLTMGQKGKLQTNEGLVRKISRNKQELT